MPRSVAHVAGCSGKNPGYCDGCSWDTLRNQRDELLAALKEMVVLSQSAIDEVCSPIEEAKIQKQVDAANAAIARAEGPDA